MSSHLVHLGHFSVYLPGHMLDRLDWYNMSICGKTEGVSWWKVGLGSSKAKNPRGRRPRGFLAVEPPEGQYSPGYPPRLFHILPFFCNPALVTGILLQPVLPLGSILVNINPPILQYWQCKSQYTREGFRQNEECIRENNTQEKKGFCVYITLYHS